MSETPLELAMDWVRAGGREGAERVRLMAAIHSESFAEIDYFRPPSGRDVYLEAQALKLWKAAAHRAIAKADRMRGPGGGAMAPRVPRTVLVTERQAAALDRGEAVTITGAMLALEAAPVRS